MDDARPHDGRLSFARLEWTERLAFEVWLHEQLERQYGAPVEAPLPAVLRDLVEAA